ncbi:MAG: DUF6513 domain-containing protein [Planctomycetota bacterium]
MDKPHIHFVTGRLAEAPLRRTVAAIAEKACFDYSVEVLPITVAALMTPAWIARRWNPPKQTTRAVLPGYCNGDMQPLTEHSSFEIDRGPRDLRQLPAYFRRPESSEAYGDWDIQILAEINNCPRLGREEILRMAHRYKANGADLIDIGCDPGEPWLDVGDVVRELRDAGHRISIDSFHPREVNAATKAGAELVLSVNSSNRDAAADWGVEVVAIPDDPKSLTGLDKTVERLARDGVAARIDPILEPIGFGFAASLGRYLETRRRYPNAQMLMGIGNLTELTDVDSSGVNALLLGFCQELSIRSVLTTQVINWARSSVRECDLARRLMHYAVNQHALPKHREPRLVMLRDAEVDETPVGDIVALANQLRDHNFRVFASAGEMHLISRRLHLHHDDPSALFGLLLDACHVGDARLPDASHAFYLGYELAKANTALTLGKSYRQDEALDWGLATRPESRRYLKQRRDVGPRVESNRNTTTAADEDGSQAESIDP